MESLHYLTVQDVLWINLQVTKKVNAFDYARLEEGVFFQYAYGDSRSLVPQAVRFARGFMRMTPFVAGNEATGFVAFLAFLKINGKRLRITDADSGELYARMRAGGPEAKEELGGLVEDDPDLHPGLAPDVRGAVDAVMERYPETVAKLAAAGQPTESVA
jgi:prophage maintenance system killer protein